MLNLKKFFMFKQLSENSETTYRFSLGRLVSWANENQIVLEKLDEEGFQAFLEAQTTWKHNSKYSAYCAIRAYFRWQYGDAHPVLSFRMRREATAPQRSLDSEQLTAIFKLFEGETYFNVRNRALIALMVDSGLRAFEVCHLQTRFLFLKTNSCKALIKGGTWEDAVFSDVTTQHLKAWMGIRKEVLFDLDQPDPKTVFFGIGGRTPGKPLTAHGLRDIFETLAERAVLEEGFSPHDLRRSFTTISLQNGANTRLVQKAGRWNDIRQVEKYSPKITARDMKPYFPMRHLSK